MQTLEVKIDDMEFAALALDLPDRHAGAVKSVTSSVANELRKRTASYAKTTNFGPYAPITTAMRKGFGSANSRGYFKGGYGQWVAEFTRYSVRPDGTAKIGLLTASDIAGSQYLRDLPSDADASMKSKWRVISKGFAASARLHAKGGNIKVTRSKQIAMAKALVAIYGKDFPRVLLPKIGSHPLKKRAVFIPVLERNRSWAVAKARELYSIKMAGGRYSRNWAKE